MWIYSQSTGRLSGNGKLIGFGYSGLDADRNNPPSQSIPDKGPIPRGSWTIGAPIEHTELGPLAMPLTPNPGTETFGRSGFFIHGDSAAHPGEASHGCIVLAEALREQIVASEDHDLAVVI